MKKHMLIWGFVCVLPVSTCLVSCANKKEPVFIDQSVEKESSSETELQTTYTQPETSTTLTTTTTAPPPIEYHSFKKISCSSVCSAAITSDGKLYTWGDNKYGQLGIEHAPNMSTPVFIMDNVADFVYGREYAAAITVDGALYTWGNNKNGSLGNGTKDNSYSPCRIMDNVKSVAFSEDFGAAITTDNELYLWGRNDDGQVGDGSQDTALAPIKVLNNVIDVKLGAYHTVALTTSGEMFAWGSNGYGELGIGEEGSYSGPPRIVTSPVKVKDNIAKIVSGDASVTAAISNSGELFMCGMNYDGQIGNGKTWVEVNYPYKVMSDVSSAYVAEEYSAAITTSGELYMWGESEQRQLGITDGIVHHKPAFVMSNVNHLFFRRHTSYETVYAITNDNEMYAWGVNISSFGNDGESYQSPQKVLDNIKEVDSCDSHVLALTTDDRLLTWGKDNIWYNDIKSSQYPVEITIINDPSLTPVVNTETISSAPDGWKEAQISTLYDPDNVFDDANYKALVQNVHETGDKINMNISVCILNSSGQNMSDEEIATFSDDKYDEWFNNPAGKDTDGLLLTLNLPAHYMYISTSGAGMQIYYSGKSENRIGAMLDNLKDYLRNEDYPGAVRQFCDDAVKYYNMGTPEIH